jgi:hypothetical protein
MNKEELIEKIGDGVAIQGTNRVLDKLRELGFIWCDSSPITAMNFRHTTSIHVHTASTGYDFYHIAKSGREPLITEKEFLSYFNPEPKLTIKLELENATEFKEVHEPMTYAEKQEKGFIYISERALKKKADLMLKVDGVTLASYDDGKFFMTNENNTAKQARALNKWLTKMLEVK